MKGHADSDNTAGLAGYGDYSPTMNDYSVSTSYYIWLAGGAKSTITSSWVNGKTASDVVADMMAFNVEVAGTAYVALCGATASNQTRTLDLFFSPLAGGFEDSETYHASTNTTGTSSANIQVISLTNATAGTYYITSSSSCRVSAVRFVPTAARTETKTITMSDMGVMTFSSPQGWSLPSGLKAYTATTAKSDGKLTLTAVPNDIIPPCTGVILQGTHNTEYTLTASDAAQVTINKNNCFRPVLCDYALTGEFRYGSENGSSTSWNASRNNYILAKQGGNMVFALSSGTGSLAAGKAYYSIRPDLVNYPSSDSRSFTLDFGSDETTGIGASLNDKGERINDKVFNLQGQRVDQPTKGLYVKNGKKVIIK